MCILCEYKVKNRFILFNKLVRWVFIKFLCRIQPTYSDHHWTISPCKKLLWEHWLILLNQRLPLSKIQEFVEFHFIYANPAFILVTLENV